MRIYGDLENLEYNFKLIIRVALCLFWFML